MKDNFLVTNAHPVLRDHVVQGRHMLPGLAYIDLVYQFLRAAGHYFEDWELRELFIYEPLVVSGTGAAMLTIEATRNADDSLKIVIQSAGDGADTTAAGEARRHVVVMAHRVTPAAFTETIDIPAIRAAAAISVDDIYNRYRQLGMVHGDFMRVHGKAHITDSAVYADVVVGDEALAANADVIFNPALLDGSAACGSVGLAYAHASVNRRLSLPLYFRSFRACAPLQANCIARLRTESVHQRNEVSYVTLEFFDGSGRKVAELCDLAGTAGLEGARQAVPHEPSTALESASEVPGEEHHSAALQIEGRLCDLLAERGHPLPENTDTGTSFAELGVDSVALMQLLRDIEVKAGKLLSPTLLFEYGNIKELASHLADTHGASFIPDPAANGAAAGLSGTPTFNEAAASQSSGASDITARAASRAAEIPLETSPVRADDIAIIGISGRFPGASSVDELWDVLKNGKDCIAEIPQERWDFRRYRYYEDYCRWGNIKFCHWGGFIDEVDQFDAAFFNIQPLQAQCMDPQERLFLQATWQLLESAGHTRARLRQEYKRRVGVYVGSMYHDYSHIDSDISQELGSFLSFHSSIANRVSHFLDLCGPSLALDTMCSSSAVAIHTACRDLRSGDCDLAIAGGVNLSLHHKKFIGLSHEKQIGTHLGSRSFADSDGYLPAEAVGAVLLKPLAKAIAARDRILGVIKSTAVNHGGRFNGYTMPNPTAQAQVIEDCLTRAEVDPATVSYIEATSNGSMLGDPAELVALNRVFSKHQAAGRFCRVGTVKSNIGHAEAASAMTQITKVLLQFEHRQLPRSIKAEPLNPLMQWVESFHLVSELQEWPQPALHIDGRERRYPRRALLNSFGAGGTNACLLLEEFIEPQLANTAADEAPQRGPQIVLLSARTADRLPTMLQQMFEYLQRNPQISLADVAYTTQLGREAMPARLALVATTREELLSVLEQSLDFEPQSAAAGAGSLPLFCGDTQAASSAKGLIGGTAGKAMVEVLIRENDAARLAQLWVQGVAIPWSQIHTGSGGRIVALPTYPFRKERHWLRLREASNETDTTAPHRTTEVASGSTQSALSFVKQSDGVQSDVAPRNDVERAVAAIWEEVLGVHSLGVTDSFFELGGNSLLAGIVIARCSEMFNVDLDWGVLLFGADPTVEGFSHSIVAKLADGMNEREWETVLSNA